MLAAPEFIEAERVDLLDEIEVAAELQHRMLADRMMRGEEGSKLQACHGFLSGRLFFLAGSAQGTWPDRARQLPNAMSLQKRGNSPNYAEFTPQVASRSE